MVLVIIALSILVLTGVVWTLNRFLPFQICPICAGVAGTWLWMFAGMLFDQLSMINYQLPAAILMGGSVVGVAYQTEKFLPASRSTLLWKTAFIPTGFAVVYSLIFFWWTGFMVASALLLVLVFKFLAWPQSVAGPKSKRVEELTRKMKDCC